MKKALGHLAAALMVTAIWPFQLLAQVVAPGRNLSTILLVLVMLVAQYLGVAGLAALLQPLGRALLEGLRPAR